MNPQVDSLEAIKDIKRIMERSTRFISLSGLSGISAGVCALIGAFVANAVIFSSDMRTYMDLNQIPAKGYANFSDYLKSDLFIIAAITFIAALLSAFFFTWLKSRKDGVSVINRASLRLLFSVLIPMAAGGIFLFRVIDFGAVGLVAPGCLIFYGIALVNASRYTLSEIKYLGYAEIILGLINLFFIGWGLYFWAGGFGILHIVYGVYMWRKYESSNNNL